MGGNAFTQAVSPSNLILNTPRMSPEKYTELKLQYEAKMRQYLPGRNIDILKEAPEKLDYGDLDFLIESAQEPVDWLALARQLGAAGLIIQSSGKVQSCSVAVPLHGTTSPELEVYFHEHNSAKIPKTVSTTEYAQIDLEVVPQEFYKWHCFYSSYGDLGAMVGHMIHNLGFTICDRGLMLRLAEMDAAKELKYTNVPDKAGKMLLSQDPREVMTFLGLDVPSYLRGFTTTEELYCWLSQCRFLSEDSVKIKRDDANGRQKERKRPLYTNFFNTWLPEHLRDQIESESSTSQSIPDNQRQMYQMESVAYFGKQEEYEQTRVALVRRIEYQIVDHLLKPIIVRQTGIPERKTVEVLRAFRRWVEVKDGKPYVLSTPHGDDESQLNLLLDAADRTKLQDEQAVSVWVKESWEVLKGLERARAKSLRLPSEQA